MTPLWGGGGGGGVGGCKNARTVSPGITCLIHNTKIVNLVHLLIGTYFGQFVSWTILSDIPECHTSPMYLSQLTALEQWHVWVHPAPNSPVSHATFKQTNMSCMSCMLYISYFLFFICIL